MASPRALVFGAPPSDDDPSISAASEHQQHHHSSMATTPLAEKYRDVKADELDDLLSALSMSPEIDIRSSATPSSTASARPSKRIAASSKALSSSSSPGGVRPDSTRQLSRATAAKDYLATRDKGELVVIATDLVDYIVGRTKVLKHEKLLSVFESAEREREAKHRGSPARA